VNQQPFTEKQPIRTIYDLIDVVRPNPSLYAIQSLAELQAFFAGFYLAVSEYRISVTSETPPFSEFSGWVARKLGGKSLSLGWCQMICEDTLDEELALGRFFQLIEEFRQRRPFDVAYVRFTEKHRPTGALGTVETIEDGVATELPPPSAAKLTRYTTDSGLFLIYLDEQDNEWCDGHPNHFGFHTTEEAAMAQVQREFGVSPTEWTVL
jgi:hypothetical protein